MSKPHKASQPASTSNFIKQVIEADLAYQIDNMEGLTWHRSTKGEIILTLISDDNFNHFLQRTILLQFALADEGKAAAVKP